MNRVFNILILALLLCAFLVPANAAQPKEWTTMVFINADNNLDAFGVSDLEQLVSSGGSTDYHNIIVLLDRYKAPTKLYYVTSEGAEILNEYEDLDMGDYNILVDFVVDTAKAYPAKYYNVIMWNHGSGWKEINTDVIKGISYDDTSGNHITTEQLTIAGNMMNKALGRKIDVFCFDACLMQMIEVAYNLKDNVDYIVASQEVEPGHGYPYDQILKNFKKGMTPGQLAEMIVKEFAKSYDNGSQGFSSTTQSAIKADRIDALIDAINGFSKALMSKDYAPEIKLALNAVQKFYYRTNIDLGHLVKLIMNNTKDIPVQTAGKKLLEALDNAVYANGLSGYNTKFSTGIAIYFPTSSYSFANDYSKLSFAQNTHWEQMVKDYYKKSTIPRLLSQVKKGDVSGLREYTSTANENNREMTHELISHLNFVIFTEKGIKEKSTCDNLSNIIKDLRTK